MLKYIIAAIQLLLLIIILTLWRHINRYVKRLPEDEALGEERANYLTTRVNIMMVCIFAVAGLFILQIVLRFI